MPHAPLQLLTLSISRKAMIRNRLAFDGNGLPKCILPRHGSDDLSAFCRLIAELIIGITRGRRRGSEKLDVLESAPRCGVAVLVNPSPQHPDALAHAPLQVLSFGNGLDRTHALL